MRHSISIPVFALLYSSTLAAQGLGAASEAALQERACADAAVSAAFNRNTYDEQVGRRVVQAVRCPNAGPQLLANRWMRPMGDTLLVLQIAEASQAIIDRRLAIALVSVVENASRTIFERVHALQALATQINPEFVARLGNVVQLAPNAGSKGRFLDRIAVDPSPSPRAIGVERVDDALRRELRDRLTVLRDARANEDIGIAIRSVLLAMR